MLKWALVVLIMTSISTAGASTDITRFLKSCGYGTLGGALAGVVSLAFTDKPSEHLNNIAKGASLGLYFGIGYGLYRVYGEEDGSSSLDYGLTLLPSSTGKNSTAYFSVLYRL